MVNHPIEWRMEIISMWLGSNAVICLSEDRQQFSLPFDGFFSCINKTGCYDSFGISKEPQTDDTLPVLLFWVALCLGSLKTATSNVSVVELSLKPGKDLNGRSTMSKSMARNFVPALMQ